MEAIPAVAINSNVDNVTCKAEPSTLDNSALACGCHDECCGACAHVPGDGYQPSILIGVPEAEKVNGTEAAETKTLFDTLTTGFAFPADGAAVTIQVADSSLFAPGQWLYLVGMGLLEITDAPTATSLQLTSRGTRGNAEGTTPVVVGTPFMVTSRPPADMTADEIGALIDAGLEEAVPVAVEEAIDDVPRWPNENVGLLNAGRLPLFRFSDDEDKRLLGYQNVDQTGHGPVMVRSNSDCATSEDVRLDELQPEARVTGQLAVMDRPDPNQTDKSPHQFALAAENLEEPPEGFGLLGSWVETLSAGVLREKWHLLKKAFFPLSWFETPTVETEDVEILVGRRVNGRLRMGTMTMADGEVLVGVTDGKVRKRQLKDMLIPQVIMIASTEIGQSTPYTNGSFNLPGSKPEGVTHVMINVTLNPVNENVSWIVVDGQPITQASHVGSAGGFAIVPIAASNTIAWSHNANAGAGASANAQYHVVGYIRNEGPFLDTNLIGS